MGKPIGTTSPEIGSMVDGVFDGPMQMGGTTYDHRMGCVIRGGQITNDCRSLSP